MLVAFWFGVWLAQLFGYPASATGPLPSKPAPPSTGAYLGAWVNTGTSTTAAEESATEGLEGPMGRPFAIHLHYYGFNVSTGKLNSLTGDLTKDPTIAGDIKYHRMPSVTWTCGAPLIQYYQGGPPGHGELDNEIDQAAYALKALNVPVFFRLFFEFNDCLLATNCANSYNPNCFPQGATNTVKGTQFKAAWAYVYNRFQTDGATNVAFEWDPSGPPADVSANNLQYFVPSSAYVDWVGFDCYDKQQLGFVNVMAPFYNWFTSTYPSYGKPMMIEETGEENNDTTPSCDDPPTSGIACSQAQYWSDIGANIASDYPLIKAIVWFDANTAYDWLFDSGGISGLNTTAGLSYFGPMGY